MDKLLQYRQIDFLRLFRLCKEFGFINRKRKMPTEYGSDASATRGAGKRLLRALLKHLFSDFEINSDHGTYYMVVPREIKESFNFISNHGQDYFDTIGVNGATALQKFSEIRQTIDGHVCPTLPHEISIYMQSRDPSSLYHIATKNGTSNKPPEDFFRCARACVKFKKIWDENVPFLVDFAKEEIVKERDRLEEIRARREERRRQERKRIEAERKDMEKTEAVRVEQIRKLERDAVKEKDKRIQNAQSLFDGALKQFQKLRSERNES